MIVSICDDLLLLEIIVTIGNCSLHLNMQPFSILALIMDQTLRLFTSILLIVVATPLLGLTPNVNSQSFTSITSVNTMVNSSITSETTMVSSNASETVETLTVTTGTLQVGLTTMTQLGVVMLAVAVFYGVLRFLASRRREHAKV